MWRSFKDWPIQRKLTGMALFSTGLALLLVIVAFVVNDMMTLRQMTEARMTVLADVIGTNSTAALTFRDQKAAIETLAALRQAPHITFAEIYTADRNAFASYTRGDQTSRQTAPAHTSFSAELGNARQSRLTDHLLEQAAPISMDGQLVGWILLRSDLDELDQRLTQSAVIAMAIFLVSGLAALAVSRRLQRAITDPLLRLVDTTRTVSESGNYSLRAEALSPHDEIGFLVRGLNAMLEQIQSQHTMLQRHREVLEAEVAQRTEDLSHTLRTMEETQHFLNSMIENLPIMVFAKHAGDLTFARWNRAAEELTGYSRDEMLGKCDYDFFPKEEADFFTAKDRDVMARGTLLDIPEETIHTKHRGTRILRTKKLPVCDDRGRPRFLLGIAEDITEQKQAEAALREQMQLSSLSADINETLAHGATLPEILQQCTTSLIRHLDVAFARVWLLKPGDICHECHKSSACTNHAQCLHLAASAGLSENLNGEYRRIPLGALKIGKIAQGWGAMTTNDVVHDERLPNKQWLTEQGLQAFAGFPLKIGAQVIGVMALFSRQVLSTSATETLERIAQVVSIGVERKRAEGALHGSEERLALTVQGSNIGIWDRNLITDAAYFSPQWKLQLGYQDHEITNTWSEWETRLHPDDHDGALRTLQSFIDGAQGRFELEYRLRHADGSYRWILSRGALIRDAYAVASRMVGIHIDTTEAKCAEQELRRAKDAAEAASQAKSQFLANMSHEIRTPMNGVLGMTELLLASAQDSRQRHLTESIQRSGESLLAVINDILDFSKIEAGKLQLERLDFDVQETVEESVELFAAPAQRKGLELTCHLSGSFQRTLRGDPVRLRQALLNLLGNAIKFTPQGSIHVRVESVADTPETVTLRFAVSDTGIGIPAEAQARIFDAFSQVDGSTTRRFGGTGLGLTIVKELVGLMQGQLGVESRPEEGSTFWFTAVFQRQALAVAGPAQTALNLHGKKILVVDDTAANREILEEHLRSWGAVPTLTLTGQDALSCLQTAADGHQPFDLAILDLHMPEMDGLMLAHAIRTDQRLAGLRLLMLTSVGYDTYGTDAPEVDAWVTKPIRKSLLYQALLGLCRTHSKEAAARARELRDTTEASRTNPLRILLVEDTPVNREVAIGMLEILGHSADVAENGRHALEAIARTAYDLVLMDCQMPVMDGFAATDAIRNREQSCGATHRLPIIALTAHAVEGDRARCLAAGMDDYLAKPFTLQQLRDTLSRWTPTAHTPSEPDRSALDAKSLVDETAWNAIRALHHPGRPNLLHKTLALYLTSSQHLVDQLQQAVQQQDIAAAGIAAHTLKSSSAVLGAQPLADLCLAVEQAARTGDSLRIAELVPRIIAMRTSVCAVFTKELNSDQQEAA